MLHSTAHLRQTCAVLALETTGSDIVYHSFRGPQGSGFPIHMNKDSRERSGLRCTQVVSSTLGTVLQQVHENHRYVCFVTAFPYLGSRNCVFKLGCSRLWGFLKLATCSEGKSGQTSAINPKRHPLRTWMPKGTFATRRRSSSRPV